MGNGIKRSPTSPRVVSRTRPSAAALMAFSLGAALAAATLPVPAPTAAAVSITAFTVDGGPGTWVGDAIPKAFTDVDSTIVDTGSTAALITFSVSGTSGDVAGHQFWASFAAPPGATLSVGVYPSAVRVGSQGTGQPGLDVYGDGRGCNTVQGEFEVHQISFTGGSLTMFAASYAFQCDGRPGIIRGDLRYQSTVGFTALVHTPDLATFPDTTVLTTSAENRVVTFRNAGTQAIAMGDHGFGGSHPQDYQLVGTTCTGTLAAGATCQATIRFAPTEVGDRYAHLVVDDDTPAGSHHAELRGPAFWPVYGLVPDRWGVEFGTVIVGTDPVDRTITFTNSGAIPALITAVDVSGYTAGTPDDPDLVPNDFAIVDQGCPIGALAIGDSCQITVRFAPTRQGGQFDSLRVHLALAAPVAVSLVGDGLLPQSGIGWGTTRKAGPAYTWNSGNSLARTVKSSSQRLHVGYATDRIGSTWARNTGPYMGIYYTRSTSGTTWTTPKRVNPSKQHAQRMGIAAAGSRVYVAWVSQTRVTNFRPTAPRVLYVRVNTSHGAATSWRSTVRLTPTSGRVDYPTVAASGYDAYIAYTDSLTGAVRLAISHDRGLSWTKRSIGSTTATTSQGRIGLPSVAVSGANVVVAWISDGSGSVSVRRSTDRGASWTPVEVITDTNVSAVSAAARGNRVAVVWTTGSEIHVRVATDGAWGPDRLVGGTGQGAQFAYSPAVALQGDSRLAVAWAEQLEGDFGWARLHWTESANDGALWFQTQTLASTSSSSRRSNDWPSILWPFESTRQVLWNGWTYGTNNYRLYLRTGIGSPIGPALAAEGALGPVTRVAPIGSGEDVDSGGHEALDQRGRRDH